MLAVVGNSPQDQRLRQDIEAAAQTWDGRVAFSYTDQLTVAEVEHLVPAGELDPDHIHTPGIYVDRIVGGAKYEKRIERVTTRPREAKADA